MRSISGLDKLSRQMKEASRAFSEMDGELGRVQFDPHDPASIEAAIQKVEQMIDEKLGGYTRNVLVAPVIEKMKEKYRESIINNARESRLKDNIK